MAEVTMSLEEYQALLSMVGSMNPPSEPVSEAPPKPKRKKSAYNRRYAAAFKRIQNKYKKKSGGWKKDGFKRAQREAHRLAKK